MPKKTRAIKLTDRRGNKPWLKKKGISKYQIDTIEIKRTFLIVCEGQTEELYFRAFPVITARIKACPLGCSKSKLVECTKAIVADESYDEVWCVFDMDVKPDVVGQFEDYNNAIEEAERSGFNTAYSNDAFELWFVLHYQFIDQQQLRTFYYEALGNRWGFRNYDVDGKKRAFANTIYRRTLPDQPTAIRNAQRVFEEVKDIRPYHLQNPVTTAYKLVMALNEHLRQ